MAHIFTSDHWMHSRYSDCQWMEQRETWVARGSWNRECGELGVLNCIHVDVNMSILLTVNSWTDKRLTLYFFKFGVFGHLPVVKCHLLDPHGHPIKEAISWRSVFHNFQNITSECLRPWQKFPLFFLRPGESIWLTHHLIPHRQNMSAFLLHWQCHWKILDSSIGYRLLAGWATNQKIFYQKFLLNDPLLGPTILSLRCWNINYPGICKPFIASIQTNIVAAHLERWQARKPSHVERRCNRADFDGIGNMDKADDLPTYGTIFPIRSQYSEGSRAYCLWSILCRSSSSLHRLHFSICWMVSLAVE